MEEHSSMRNGQRCTGGVSSFGFSGTIVHAAVRSCGPAAGTFVPALLVLCSRLRRRSILWSKPLHPLLQSRLEQITILAGCRSPSSGHVCNLVAHHVVNSRVLFPGAAYLEMARAVCTSASGARTSKVCLHAVLFLQPLVLDNGPDCGALFVECVLHHSGMFEVRSGDQAALQRGDAPLHCSGTASPTETSQRELARAAVIRNQSVRACSLVSLHERFHEVGLQYGPAYRLLTRAWAARQHRSGGSWRGAVARLRWRLGSAEMLVHPAELDSALQLCAVASPSNSFAAGEMRLPFAVDRALLQTRALEVVAVRSPELASKI